MTIQYKEVKLTPLEDAYHFYWFINEDLKEGLNYSIGEETAHVHLSALMEHSEMLGLKIKEPVFGAYDSYDVANCLWEVIKKIKEVTKR